MKSKCQHFIRCNLPQHQQLAANAWRLLAANGWRIFLTYAWRMLGANT